MITGLNQAFKFGKHKGTTPKELIDKGKSSYLNYLFEHTKRRISAEAWEYLDTYNKTQAMKKK